jgi:hypothetical protein
MVGILGITMGFFWVQKTLNSLENMDFSGLNMNIESEEMDQTLETLGDIGNQINELSGQAAAETDASGNQ